MVMLAHELVCWGSWASSVIKGCDTHNFSFLAIPCQLGFGVLKKQSQVLVEGNATSEIIEVDVTAGVSLGVSWDLMWIYSLLLPETHKIAPKNDGFQCRTLQTSRGPLFSGDIVSFPREGTLKVNGQFVFSGLLLGNFNFCAKLLWGMIFKQGVQRLTKWLNTIDVLTSRNKLAFI